jgi:hypothetical protein
VTVALLDLLATPQPIRWSQFPRWLLTLLALPFVGFGWVIAKIVRTVQVVLFGLGYAMAWTVAAVKVGYRAGHGAS